MEFTEAVTPEIEEPFYNWPQPPQRVENELRALAYAGESAPVRWTRTEKGASGLALNKITPSSPFRRLGIRNGDIILGINDQQVDNLGDVVKSLAAVSAGEELSLKIKRRGRERQLDFQFE